MSEYNIGDVVQVETFPDFSGIGKWSEPYKIYKINSPDDKNAIGYCSQTSYWMESLCGKWQRTWYALKHMRKYISTPQQETSTCQENADQSTTLKSENS